MTVAVHEDHTCTVRAEAFEERFTVGELIALGKDLEKAVERGMSPQEYPSFLIDGQRGYVKEITVIGDIPVEPPKKKAAKKAAAPRGKKAVESKPEETAS